MDNCNKCNQPKEMYYVPWCPRCDKPELISILTLNAIQALDHIEAVTGDKGTPEKYHLDGFKRRVWEWMMDTYEFSNGSYVSISTDELDELPQDVQKFINYYELEGKDVLLYFSW